MRGQAQRGQAQRGQRSASGDEAAHDDFWSWRQAMYALAGSLDPERMHAIARVAYRELHACGVRTVGEFHYVHHQADGTPYRHRNTMSEAVIAAARAEGLRIALLRVVYARAGEGKPPEGIQRRFCDTTLDAAFQDIDDLRSHYADADDVRIGIAPHSVRAIEPEWLAPIAAFAEERALPVHMHVAEQPAEISACLAETGRRPVELLAHHGLLSDRFVAVHATHLGAGEAALLGQARAFACLCPTTERDLGDGLPHVSDLLASGTRLCVGIDSHVLTSPLEDIRGVELGERLRTGRRNVLDNVLDNVLSRPTEAAADDSLAAQLWRIGSIHGAYACGFGDNGGTIAIDGNAPELALVDAANRLDAIVFGGTNRVFASR